MCSKTYFISRLLLTKCVSDERFLYPNLLKGLTASYKSQSIGLRFKSIDCFLCDENICLNSMNQKNIEGVMEIAVFWVYYFYLNTSSRNYMSFQRTFKCHLSSMFNEATFREVFLPLYQDRSQGIFETGIPVWAPKKCAPKISRVKKGAIVLQIYFWASDAF